MEERAYYFYNHLLELLTNDPLRREVIHPIYIVLLLSEGLNKLGVRHQIVRGHLNVPAKEVSFVHFWIDAFGRVLDPYVPANVTNGICPSGTKLRYSIKPQYNLIDQETDGELLFKRELYNLFRVIICDRQGVWRHIFNNEVLRPNRRITKKLIIRVIDMINVARITEERQRDEL
jgi:hypothetical protein